MSTLIAIFFPVRSSPPPSPFFHPLFSNKLDQLVSLGVPAKRLAHLPWNANLTLRQLLRHILDVSALPSPKLLRLMSQLCEHPEEATYLSELATASKYRDVAASRLTVFDLVELLPGLRLDLPSLLSLPPTLSRIYSIASSPKVKHRAARLFSPPGGSVDERSIPPSLSRQSPIEQSCLCVSSATIVRSKWHEDCSFFICFILFLICAHFALSCTAITS